MSDTQQLQISSLFNVEEWVAVVTGGSSGIGLMIAQTLFNNGAKVYIVGRNEEKLKATIQHHASSNSNSKRGELIPIQADLSTKEGIKSLRDQVSKFEKHIDLLVNNAGIASEQHDFKNASESLQALSDDLFSGDPQNWAEVYQTNVTSYYFTSVALLPLLGEASKQKQGHTSSIVNITSISGMTKVSQNQPAYNTSKGAAIHLTGILAHEFAHPGVRVRVNSVAPGIFPSEMTAGKSDEANKSRLDASGFRDKQGIPAGRPGQERDMGGAVLALATNYYINGQNLAVDGGYLLQHPS